MRRLMHRRFGAPEVLTVEEVPTPATPPGHVRVRVRVAALNPVDWKIFTGGPAAAARGLTPPLGVGNDIAGAVDAVGDGVDGFTVGDRVFGSARVHALQDLTVVDPVEERLVHTPDGLDDAVAAGLVVAGRTAWDAVERLGVGPADRLLVHGAAGGVGTIAVQLAAARGARVLGTASHANHDRVRALGAEPMAYGDGLQERVRSAGGVDAVLDAADGDGVRVGLALGVPLDRMVTIGAKDVGGVGGVAVDLATTGALAELAELAASGALIVPIVGRFPLERAADAYRELMAGHVPGKLVIDL